METTYDWLLQNTGNAGNHYTILNTQHTTTPEESGYIDVMARDKDYGIVNLLIHNQSSTESNEISPERLQGRTQKTAYSFHSEQQVIDYLSEGKTPESSGEEGNVRIQMLILEPASELGTVTFPPIN